MAIIIRGGTAADTSEALQCQSGPRVKFLVAVHSVSEVEGESDTQEVLLVDSTSVLCLWSEFFIDSGHMRIPRYRSAQLSFPDFMTLYSWDMVFNWVWALHQEQIGSGAVVLSDVLKAYLVNSEVAQSRLTMNGCWIRKPSQYDAHYHTHYHTH
jgi:hypothetical protein